MTGVQTCALPICAAGADATVPTTVTIAANVAWMFVLRVSMVRSSFSVLDCAARRTLKRRRVYRPRRLSVRVPVTSAAARARGRAQGTTCAWQPPRCLGVITECADELGPERADEAFAGLNGGVEMGAAKPGTPKAQ